MASRDDYLVGWICALPIEVAAAKATLDRIHDNLPWYQNLDNNNNYILGSLQSHNVVVAYPKVGVYGKTSVAGIATQLHASFPSVRFRLMVGIAGGVPETKVDIRLGDIVVSRSAAGWPGVAQYDANGKRAEDESIRGRVLAQPTPLLLTAIGKAETAAIFDESQMSQYISKIIRKDPVTFVHPGSVQDILFDPNCEHTIITSEENGCNHCNPDMIRPRQPRENHDPRVHYGLIASSHHWMRDGAIRDKLARKQNILCWETEAAGLKDVAQYLVIRGICDYADSHSGELWHAYAAVAAAAYAKEVLSFIPAVPKVIPLATSRYVEARPVLDALLLTRPEVDRKSLIALKGRRVDGTCEWLTQHPSYQEWLADAGQPLLWISGGPGKGKTMLAIYITEVLQPVIDAAGNVLLYYFCSNRDKNRNSALTIMRGIIHQWINLCPHLAQYIKHSFEGTETTKYTPPILENKLGQYQRIKLDDSDTEVSHDVQRYIFAKVAELASEQNLSEEKVAHIQQALLAGADSTFLWVGFVANELLGRDWDKINEILGRVPKGLGGVYQRLLQQIDDKEALVPIFQWIVLAARPLTQLK
ncbi:putative ankyrin repeat-containing protein [Botrytis fragariae]|uniref:Putative ankyrin repeat-containing protein n=1 Tax=Botrytis fragariae TaxID=1964551 RepID=A0A8H6AXG3_9HELO|nr:putative ankyrin repeat-containing protein [Botrytis fragariae]KAF5875514.1 putative ankyrin repeat-containing protein [Botrytis fragariae]